MLLLFVGHITPLALSAVRVLVFLRCFGVLGCFLFRPLGHVTSSKRRKAAPKEVTKKARPDIRVFASLRLPSFRYRSEGRRPCRSPLCAIPPLGLLTGLCARLMHGQYLSGSCVNALRRMAWSEAIPIRAYLSATLVALRRSELAREPPLHRCFGVACNADRGHGPLLQEMHRPRPSHRQKKAPPNPGRAESVTTKTKAYSAIPSPTGWPISRAWPRVARQ